MGSSGLCCALSRAAAATVVAMLSGVAGAHPGHEVGAGDPGPGGPEGWNASGVIVLSHLSLTDFPGSNSIANDCWGYVSGSGREYALIGLSGGIGFVEITDPINPNLVAFIQGPSSLWHDVKVIGDHAYAVSEGGAGIQVMDMSDIDNGVVTDLGSVGTGVTHNIAANPESGFLYRCGGGTGDPRWGLRIYDAGANPDAPVFVGEWNDFYVHDAQVVNWTTGALAGHELAFCCSGTGNGSESTALRIVDVTDKAAPALISTVTWPNAAYSHQGWLSPDRHYFYLDDELDERTYGTPTTTRIFDVSDPAAPTLLGSFTNGNTSIDHNLYTKGNLIFEANYRSGLRIYDATDPLAPVEVASLDTYPPDDLAEFDGAWSCYPYFPSGNVIISDIQQGLVVVRPVLDRLEFDFHDGLPDALDSVGGTPVHAAIRGVGLTLDPATVTLHVDDGSGVVDVAAQSPGPGEFDMLSPPVACGTNVRYWVSAGAVTGETFYAPPLAPLTAYSAMSADSRITIFADDFESDKGWTVTNDAALTAGAWARSAPLGGGDRGDPAADFDGSGQCYLTGPSDGDTDVDGGETTLTSPAFDATGGGIAFVQYAVWYSNNLGGDPNTDTMTVELSGDDGATWTTLEVFGPVSPNNWVLARHRIDETIAPTATMRLRFRASDLGTGSLVEAAVDAVLVEHLSCAPPRCPADLDASGAVDVFDLLDYLGLWFNGDAFAERTGDQPASIDVFDLLAYLQTWFAESPGCP